MISQMKGKIHPNDMYKWSMLASAVIFSICSSLTIRLAKVVSGEEIPILIMQVHFSWHRAILF